MLKYYKPKTALFKHQETVLSEMWDKEYYALFWEMGLGKTKATIDNMALLYENHMIDSALIIAPASVYSMWVREMHKHYPNMEHHVAYSLYNTKKSFMQDIADTLVMKSRLRVLFINIESLAGKGGIMADLFMASTDKTLTVIDESTYIKNHKAQRSKAVYELGKKSAFRRILTGTPITNNPMDLWGQAKFLGRGITSHTTLASFKNRYCVMELKIFHHRSFNQIVGYQNLNELSVLTTTWSSSLLKEDCLDLPKKIYSTREIPLTNKQRIMYEQLVTDEIMEYEGSTIDATNAMAMMYKLHQIVCGQLKIDDDYVPIDNERMGMLVQLTEEADTNKVVIWASYRLLQKEIYDTLVGIYGSDKVAHITSDMRPSEREAQLASFQDGDAQFFIGNPQSSGFGVTLTSAHICVYYNNTFNLEHRLQSEDRLHRIGQNVSVSYIDLHTPGTVEDRIMEVIGQKKELAKSVFTKQEIMDIVTLKG